MGGVGHKSTRQATDFFKKDRHTLDVQNSWEPTSDVVGELEMNDSEGSEKMERSSESDAMSLMRRMVMDTSLERISQAVRRRR